MNVRQMLMKVPGANLLKRARRWLLRRLGRLPAPAPASAEPPAALDYNGWIAAHEPGPAALDAQRADARHVEHPLRFGVLCAQSNPAAVEQLKQKLQEQTWPCWQVAAAGEALEVDYVVRLDEGAELAPFALFAAAQAAADRPAALYADHDELDADGRRTRPFFKPGWSPEMLLSLNYTRPLWMARADVWRRLEAEAPAGDWARALRLAEWGLPVVRIPQVLAHVRPGAAPDDPAQVEDVLRQRGLGGVGVRREDSGLPHLTWALPADARVSVIIPTRGSSPMLEACVQSILERTDYPDYEILLLNNGPRRPEEFPWFAQVQQDARVRVVHVDLQPFNYSRINNLGAAQASGQYLLFLNNDTRVLGPAWMREMVQWASLPQIGAVGARLLYPDGKVQHAGVILGLTGFAGHIFAGQPADARTIYGPLEAYRNTLAVTAACVMLRREVFEQAGGFNEEFILCGNDVELGLRLNHLGYRVMVNPFATLEHLESVTHQGNIPAQDFFTSYRFYRPTLESGDPYFNPNLSYWSNVPAWRQPGEKDVHQFVREHLEKLKEQEPDAHS